MTQRETFTSTINQMMTSLEDFAKKHPENTVAINAKQSIINKLIDYHNSVESYIHILETELALFIELKKQNESYENMLCFWHNDVIIKGKKYNLENLTVEEIMNDVRTNKPN